MLHRLIRHCAAVLLFVLVPSTQMINAYLQEGDDLVVIGDESQKDLRVAINKSDFNRFEAHLGQPVNVRISRGVRLINTLSKMEPRATNRATDSSMYTSLGGSLESRIVEDDKSHGEFETLSPHFSGVISLSVAQSHDLRAGQRGMVWFCWGQQTIESYLQRKIERSLDKLTLTQN